MQGLTLQYRDPQPGENILMLRLGRTLKTSSPVLIPATATLLVVGELAPDKTWGVEKGDLLVVRPGCMVFFLLRGQEAKDRWLPDPSDPVTRAWLAAQLGRENAEPA